MKIAVISGSEHFKVGGVETFTKMLLKSFVENDIDFDEVVYRPKRARAVQRNVCDPIHKNTVIDISGRFEWAPKKPIKIIEKWIKKNKYDLYIMNSSFYCVSRKILKSKKVIYVQHGNYDNNSWKTIPLADRIHIFFNTMFRMSIMGNPYNDGNTTVFFCPETDKSTNLGLRKYYSLTPISEKEAEYISGERSGSIWVGRIDYWHKGIDWLKEISRLENIRLDIYGIGTNSQVKKIKNDFGNKYKGGLKASEIIPTLSQKRVFVLTSKTEGMPFVIFEALSSGLAVVILNTFDAVKMFSKCDSVFAFEPNDLENASRKIKEIEEMKNDDFQKLSRKSVDFINDKLSYEDFKVRWKKIAEETANWSLSKDK